MAIQIDGMSNDSLYMVKTKTPGYAMLFPKVISLVQKILNIELMPAGRAGRYKFESSFQRFIGMRAGARKGGIQMDLVQIGKFIAELRKAQGLTQEQLGEKVGVTNKTVSRWETGTYLPPAGALLSMSKMFDVTINEILSGKRLTEEEYKRAAEENLSQTIQVSVFSLKDKITYYKKKWLKEHIAIMVFIGICIIGVFVTGIILRNSLIGYAAILMLVLAHGWRNNAMMTYVERNAYDGTGSSSAPFTKCV